ncbi:hypothetical protein IHE45_10G082400 [Dioscorea alata]|uniref:Uncharacterized protein n=1 Tax=Dioscorea alata TaxID=55571 RepID=A0ACB7VCF2_DIOAL|nr:hypothetical protein IHE45_10G082400 [Dioscorea alata]
MGGCATKPKDLNADADVPRPIDAPDPLPEDAGEKKDVVPPEETKEVAGAVLDDNRRRSLGTLFQENEVISEEDRVPSSSTDKNVIIENIEQPSVEVDVEVKGKEELKEQALDHPEQEGEPKIAETETSNPIKDEKSDAQIVKEIQEDLNTDAKPEQEEDSSDKKVVVDA